MGNRSVNVKILVDASQSATEFKRSEDSVTKIGDAAQASSAKATSAMAGYEKAARSGSAGVGQMLVQQQQLRAEAARLTQGIDLLERSIRRTPEAATLLTEKMGELLIQKRAVNGELDTLGRQLDKADGAFNKLTTRISVGRGILGGYDQAVEGVARAAGGINLAWAIGLGLASSLLPKIIELVSAKSKLIEVDEKQVTLDTVSAQLSGNLLRVNADIITSFQNIVAAQAQYTKEKGELAKKLEALETQGRIVGEVIEADGKFMRVGAQNAEQLNGRIAVLNKSLADQDNAMQPAIESLRIIQHAYGLNDDALIRLGERFHVFGNTQEEINKNLTFFKQQLDADLPSMRALANELDNGAGKAFDFERAVLSIYNAVRLLEKPKVNLDFLRGLAQDPNERINRAMQSAIGGFTQGPPSEAQLFGAIKPELEAVRNEFRENSAAIARNKAEAQALYNTYVSQLDPQYQRWIQQLKTASDNMGVFSDKNKDAERQAKALADTTRQLSKEAELAQIRIQLEGLDQKEALVKKESEFRVSELKRLKQATVENLDAIKTIETQALIEISKERIKLAGEDRVKYMQLLEKGREDRQRMQEAELKDLRQHMARQRQVREEEELKFTQQQDKLERERRSDRPGRAEAQAEEIRRQNVERERAIAIFGRLAQAEHLAALQIDLVNGKLSDQEAILTAVGSAVEQFQENWLKSGQIFQFVADGIASSMEAMVSRGEDFGANMKAMFLDMVAQIAAYFGRLFISMGAGMLFVNPAAGIGLIAAGTALMALSGIFAGLASRAHAAASASGRNSSASASSSSAATANGRSGPPTNVIPFPTSGSRNDQQITIQLDRNLSNDLIEGKQVLTRANVQKKHKDVIKKVANF